jgi:hypothetical protein
MRCFCFLLTIDRSVPGESKAWSQLNAVERHSAEWLGYNEQRWKVRRLCFGVFGVRLI